MSFVVFLSFNRRRKNNMTYNTHTLPNGIRIIHAPNQSAVAYCGFAIDAGTRDEAENEQELRLHGGDKGEFGATTGRPRRVGWFDAVATRYGVLTQGATEVVVTALDCQPLKVL